MKYKDTGWQDVRITGLAGTAGEELTVTFTLDTNTTAAHDSWVYVDLADIVPPTVSIASPLDGSVVTTATPALDFTTADDPWGSGIAPGTTQVVLDGTLLLAPGPTLPTLQDGEHIMVVTVEDNAQNTGSAASTFTVVTDSTPPSTVASLSSTPTDSGWYRNAVTVSLAASDDVSQMVQTYWRIDEGSSQGAPTPYTEAAKPLLTKSSQTLYYWSIDTAGNAEEPKSLSLPIDSSVPDITLIAKNGPTSKYNRPVFDFGAADSGSGLVAPARVELVKLDESGPTGEPWIVTPTSGEPLDAALGNGSYRLTVKADDKAGNHGEDSVDFTVAAPPIAAQSGAPWEGDIVGLFADSDWIPEDPANLGDFSWTVSNPTDPNDVTFQDPFGFIVLDSDTEPAALETEVPYNVKLTVTDNNGQGATGAICEKSLALSSSNVPPRVHALDVEVVEGQPAHLVGRFIDPGWSESHTASWSISDVDTVRADVTEDNFPAMASGYVYGETRPLTLADDGRTGALTVSDGIDTTEVRFTITVKPNTSDPYEGANGNDTITAATPDDLQRRADASGVHRLR